MCEIAEGGETSAKDVDAMAQALSAIDVGIAVFDAGGRFVTCNARYRDLLPGSDAVLQPGAEYWVVMVDHAETVFSSADAQSLSQLATQTPEEIATTAAQFFRTRDGRWLELQRHHSDAGGFVCLWTDVTTRMEVEAELAKAQSRLRDAIQSLPDGFLLLDPDDRVSLHNSGFATLFGMSAGQTVVGRTYREIMEDAIDRGLMAERPADGAARAAWLDERMERHFSPKGPIETRLADGRWLRVSETRTIDGGGVAIHSDITEIKRREDDLARATALLDAVTVAATRIIGHGDWQFGIEELLSRLGQALRIGRAGLYQVHTMNDGAVVEVCLFEWTAPGTPKLAHDPERRMARLDVGDGSLDGWILRLKRGDTIRGLVSYMSGPLRRRLEDRGVQSFLAVPIVLGDEWWGHVAFDDVERPRSWSVREAEVLRTAATMLASAIQRAVLNEELGKTEARKQAIVETALDCVLTIDASGLVVEYNPAAERTLGWPRGEALGRRMDELIIPPEIRAAHRAGVARILNGGESRLLGRRIEMTAMRRDGSRFPCELALTASKVGDSLFFTAYLRDITERKETERAMREARIRAEMAVRAKNSFLNNMSHELRTPLNAVIGFSELLKEEVMGPLGTPKYREFAHDIYDSGRHLLDIINDVLDMSRIEAGERQLVPEPLDLDEAVHAALALIRDRAKQDDLHIKLDLDPAAALLADRRATLKILQSLLSNAVKFTPAGGTVTVSARRRPDGATEIAVVDTGVGIPPDAVERVFQPFQQAEMGLNRRHEGVGLGLAMARALIGLHGGDITLESVVGQGTKVVVVFPPEAGLDPATALPGLAAES